MGAVRTSLFRPWLIILPFGVCMAAFQGSARWLGEAFSIPALAEYGIPLLALILILVPATFSLKKPIRRVAATGLAWFKPDFMKRVSGPPTGPLSFTSQFVVAFGIPIGITFSLSGPGFADPGAILTIVVAVSAFSAPIGFMFWEEYRRPRDSGQP